MKRFLKYIILFFVAYITINIGIKFYTSTQWKSNQTAIAKLIKHCTQHTQTKFPKLDLSIEDEAEEFILTGRSFTNQEQPEKEFFKRCISQAIYYYSPSEYFSIQK